MAIWWMTEAIPLAATALLPIPLFPFLGIMRVEKLAQVVDRSRCRVCSGRFSVRDFDVIFQMSRISIWTGSFYFYGWLHHCRGS